MSAMQRTYLDFNATAPLRPAARDAMLAALEVGGNPSSVHAEGRRARAIVDRAREQVAALVGARADEVVFTSGATEAAATVLRRNWRTIFYAPVEHPCVTGPVLASEGRIVNLPVTPDGAYDMAALEAAIERETASGTPAAQMLLAVQLANNETGVVQDVAALTVRAREAGVLVLCDAVQAAGRIRVDLRELGADYLMLSAHKIGGPKGIGAVIVREGAPFAPLLIGGGQETRRRAGTENVEAIAGFGAAAELAAGEVGTHASHAAALRDGLEAALIDVTPSATVIGAQASRLPNTVLVAVPGVRSETLVIALDLAGIAVSSGSACASGKVSRSAVLTAMGLEKEIIDGAVRFSLGWSTTRDDIERCASAWSRLGALKALNRSEGSHAA